MHHVHPKDDSLRLMVIASIVFSVKSNEEQISNTVTQFSLSLLKQNSITVILMNQCAATIAQ
jgi:hypothetical protein